MKVQGEEVGPGDEDEGVEKTDAECCHVGSLEEEIKWHQGIGRKTLLNEEEQRDREDTEDDETYNSRRVPGKGNASEFEAEENHDSACYHGQ